MVQNVRKLTYNAQLKVTIAKYYTPSGRCIQALDYTHRNSDGSVGSIADSLKTSYTTSNGRTVYDGGGVDPDVVLKGNDWPKIVTELVQQGQVYLYANEFKLVNETIAAPADFNLTDTQFNDFSNWVLNQEFEYESSLEKEISKLESISTKLSAQSEMFSTTMEAIKSEIREPLKGKLAAEKILIKQVLEEEIALRYYNERGGIEANLGDDLEIAKAVEILNNPTKYKNILSGVR